MHLETLLFLLPTLVYTDPTWNKVQQQIPRTGSLPLAIVNVVARNEMPVPVSLLLAHQRGNDKSTRKERIYGYQQPGEYWREKYSVLFERMRTGWDKWEAMIRFENPSWAFWTDAFYAVLGEEYAGDWVGLNVTLEGMVTGLAPGGGKTRAPFIEPGTNFPEAGLNTNAFFLLEVEQSFEQSTSVSVGLEGDNKWWQDQTFMQEKGSTNRTLLPFFFESNTTKLYYEGWDIQVRRSGKKTLKSTKALCEVLPKDAGGILVAKVNGTGWSLERNSGEDSAAVMCQRTWEEGTKDSAAEEDGGE